MSKLIAAAVRLLTVPYKPHPNDRPFLQPAQTRDEKGLAVTAAVLSDHESRRFFGVQMVHRGMQPVWLRVVNRTDWPFRLDFLALDPAYYTPLEAAYLNHLRWRSASWPSGYSPGCSCRCSRWCPSSSSVAASPTGGWTPSSRPTHSVPGRLPAGVKGWGSCSPRWTRA